jgi:hypothetical protein
MNNDDIIRLAIEHTINGLKFNEEGLLRFAKLVAEHEREACAKIVENEAWQYTSPVWAVEIVNDIRARGQA